MIKGKVRIAGWPPVGAESFKPRFKIRQEYDIVEVKDGMAAVLDDHNQVAYVGLDLLVFVELQDREILSLDDFLKKHPERDPDAVAKREKAEAAAVTQAANEAAVEADRVRIENEKKEAARVEKAAKASKAEPEAVATPTEDGNPE